MDLTHDWIKAPGAPGCEHATLFETILAIEVDRPPSISPGGGMEGAKSFYNVVSELVNLGSLGGFS